MCDGWQTHRVSQPVRRQRSLPQWWPGADPITDILGVLTICVYGSWYYGYGVIIDDVGVELGLGAAARRRP